MKTHFYSTIFLTSFALFFSNLLIGQETHTKPEVPAKLHLILDTTQKGPTTTLTVQCSILVKFSAGFLTLELPSDTTITPGKLLTLWRGKSDSAFGSTFSYQVKLPEEKKSKITAHLEFTTTRGKLYRVSRSLFTHNTSSGLIYTDISFDQLDRIELKKELQAKGLDGMSIEQIRSRDPDLARKVERINPQRAIEDSEAVKTEKYKVSPPVIKPKKSKDDATKVPQEHNATKQPTKDLLQKDTKTDVQEKTESPKEKKQ